jgi:hypothetical protein
LYRYITSAQTTAHDLAVTMPYLIPHFYRADTGSAMLVTGVTAANATVNLGLGTATNLATLTADSSGNFSGTLPALTTALVVGKNNIAAQASSGTDRSTVVNVPVILDVTPPAFSAQTPTTSNVQSLSPLVAVTFLDIDGSTTSVSGIDSQVITLKIDGVAKTFKYDYQTGLLKWVDTLGLPPSMTNNSAHTVLIQGGDTAGYKTSITWTFSVLINAAEGTAPAITCVSNTTSLLQATLDDPESGVKPTTVQLTITRSGTPTVVIPANSATIADYYTPTSTGGSLTYIPSPALASGDSYTIVADHWATSNPRTQNCVIP